MSNLIVSAEKAWQDQSQAVAFAWRAADGAAFDIPGTIKYAMDYDQWRNFGRAEASRSRTRPCHSSARSPLPDPGMIDLAGRVSTVRALVAVSGSS